MAQPPQFRPGGPGGPPPGAPGMPPGPPGAQRLSAPQMMPPQPLPPTRGMSSLESSGDVSKKSKKGKKKRVDDSDEEEDNECKCPPQQPSTQIFICPPGSNPQDMGMMGGGQGMGMMGGGQGMGFGQGFCGAGNEGFGSPSQCPTQDFIDPAKLCQIQCYGGGKSEDTQTQVICCPPSSCAGCQKKSQQRQKPQGCVCQACGQECPSRKSKKPQAGTMEGIMPASQQFLMFLQAYGLAAALIRDRNRREDERQQKEFEERKKDSKSKDTKGSAKGDKEKKKK